MNTSGLARHYDTLTARERLPLILAALTRGDDAEAERLTGSAPTRPALVPHYYGLWEALSLLSVVHQTMQLERVCSLFAATGLLQRSRVDEDEANGRLRLVAFRFVIDAHAWGLLCAELRLDSEAILRHLPGRDLVRQVEGAARQIAFTPEEALVYLRSQPKTAPGPPGRGEDRLDTAADVARGMREFLAEPAQSLG
jgi:hypothetical protein